VIAGRDKASTTTKRITSYITLSAAQSLPSSPLSAHLTPCPYMTPLRRSIATSQ
jgi:hypothetical protein